MQGIRIHEQITALRKARGMTQEQLAQRLGVSNQAVSKWEAGQCCPDIQLLPALADIFGVSCDMLLGVASENKAEEALRDLRQSAAAMPLETGFPFLCRAAAVLHSVMLLQAFSEKSAFSGFGMEQMLAMLDKGEWGSTVLSDGRYGSAMNHGAVLFADRSRLAIDVQRVAALLVPFTDPQTLSVAAALGELTVEEDTYASVEEIAARCLLPPETVSHCLTVSLLGCLETQRQAYRLKDGHAMLLPLLSLFDCH